MFKKIYIEITNNCNLNCSFCIKNNRKKEFISINRFKILLEKLKGHTNYLYFHVMGEPLLHPQINQLINLASKDYNINITTNGYLINKIKDNKNIRQLNISLHSFNLKYNKSLSEYMNNIFDCVDNLIVNNTYISFRMWTNNQYKEEIIKLIEERYNIIINGHTNISDKIFYEEDIEFIWPNLDNDYYNINGSCMGLRTHFGVLVDGSIIPCCLDSNGIINLGNIYNDDLDIILNSNKVTKMINGFKNNIKCEELCKHCNFYDRIEKRNGSDIDV